MKMSSDTCARAEGEIQGTYILFHGAGAEGIRLWEGIWLADAAVKVSYSLLRQSQLVFKWLTDARTQRLTIKPARPASRNWDEGMHKQSFG